LGGCLQPVRRHHQAHQSRGHVPEARLQKRRRLGGQRQGGGHQEKQRM